MKKKNKQEPLYVRIANLIKDIKTIQRDDFPFIGWTIAEILIKNSPKALQYKIMGNGFPGQVQRCVYPAIRYLAEHDINVYLYKPHGQKPLEAISIDSEYKKLDLERIKYQLDKDIKHALVEIELKHPTQIERVKILMLPLFTKETNK